MSNKTREIKEGLERTARAANKESVIVEALAQAAERRFVHYSADKFSAHEANQLRLITESLYEAIVRYDEASSQYCEYESEMFAQEIPF